MKALLFAVFATLFTVGLSVVQISCPKHCKCEHKNGTLSAKCTSQKFLSKIDDKHAGAFSSLDLSNSNIATLDKRLKKLRNLRHLDLSNNEVKDLQHFPAFPKLKKLSLANNQLKELTFSWLPTNIEDLDISHNLLVDLPKDWINLHHLSSLHISNNPINCDDTAVNGYVTLVAHKINITEKVICHSPKNVKGKILQSLIAEALLNPMMGDQEELKESEEDEDNSEFIRHTTTEKPEKENKNLHDDLFEGSGSEEGSGDGDKENLSPCALDCTTLKPLEILKENNSPIQAIKEQVGILFEDIFGKEEEPTTSPSPLPQKPSTPVEENISKKTLVETMTEPNTTKKTENLAIAADKDKDWHNLERASLGGGEDGYTYYLIATVIILMVIVAIFILIKKRSSHGKMNRRRNSMAENGICEEMKPLGKYKEITNGTHNEKPKEDDLRPERIPLMNGQNGKSDVPSGKDSLEDLDVTLRTPSESDASPTKPERVTVTASEIPPNVLKTPQLVHRQVNSDGEIITKPLDDSY